MRALVRKCLALSPILLSIGSAHSSDMDGASYDASFSFLCASYILSISRKLVASVKVNSLIDSVVLRSLYTLPNSHSEWWCRWGLQLNMYFEPPGSFPLCLLSKDHPGSMQYNGGKQPCHDNLLCRWTVHTPKNKVGQYRYVRVEDGGSLQVVTECQRTPLGRLLGIYPIYCLYFIFILSSLHICLSLFGYHLISSSCQHYTPYLIITGIPLLLLAVSYLA